MVGRAGGSPTGRNADRTKRRPDETPTGRNADRTKRRPDETPTGRNDCGGLLYSIQ
jgi:hypothetical protein